MSEPQCFQVKLPVPESLLVPYSTWQHFKGGTYTVLEIVTDRTNSREGERLVEYISHDYQSKGCRKIEEFLDGRFIPLPKKEHK